MKKIDWKIFCKKKMPVLVVMVLVALALHMVKSAGTSVGLAGSGNGEPWIPMEEGLLEKVVPEAGGYEMRDSLLGVLYGSYGDEIGKVLYSGRVVSDNYGYGGRVAVYLLMDGEKKIEGLVLAQNHETPSHVRRLYSSGFMDSWNGFSVDSALSVVPDAVSGSTYSSEAVIKSVQGVLSSYSDREAEVTGPQGRGSGFGTLLTLVVIFAGLYFFFFPTHSRPYLLLMYVASVAVLGIWRAEMLSMDRMYGWVIYGVSATSALLFVLFILSVLLPLFTGKAFYCSYVCPYGAAQSLLQRIPLTKWKIPSRVEKYLRYVQPLLLLGCVVAAFLPGVSSLINVEVFAGYHYQAASAWVLSLFSLFLFLSLFVNRPWCRFFCPTGFLLRLFQQGTDAFMTIFGRKRNGGKEGEKNGGKEYERNLEM